MTDPQPADVNLTVARCVDQLCTDFEIAWQAGAVPCLEDFLQRVDSPDQAGLLQELVLVEQYYRRQRGEEPRLEEYLERFPQAAGPLREQFAAGQALHQNGCATVELLHSRVGPEVPVHRPVVPGYEISGELGRGSMGVVYQARHLQLKRLVALKMILAGDLASPRALARFVQEAQALARLHHANVVQVYEVGEYQGRPYLSLELLEGGSLGRKLGGAPLPPREAARLVETLAHAVAAIHAGGVVHRDLKPSNVLLAADGSPKITDFGVARDLDGERHTETGEVLGTPSYMAPEQVRGARDMGPAVDVYALGAILYECLTGRPPFRAATSIDTMLQVLHNEPVPVRSLQPGTPVDLETICLKCLGKEPRRRYGSAGELADDLARYLRDEPIRARPVSRLERGWRWTRRNPVLAGLTTALAALLVLIAVGATLMNLQLRGILTDLEDSEKAGRKKLLASYLNEARAGRFSRQVGQRFRTLEVIEKAVALARELDEPSETFVELRTHALSALVLPDLKPASEWVSAPNDKMWTSSFGRIDPLHRYFAAGEAQGAISIRRVGSGPHDTGEIARLPALSRLPRFVWSSNGDFLAVWHQEGDQQVQIFRMTHGKSVRILKEVKACLAFCFTPDGHRLLTANRDGKLREFDLASGGEVVHPLIDPAEKALAETWEWLAHHPHLRQVAFAGPNDIFIVDLQTGKTVQSMGTGSRASFGAWHPEGQFLAFTEKDFVNLWDTRLDKITTQMEHRGGGLRLSFNPTGDLLMISNWSNQLTLWNPHSGREVFRTVGTDASFGPHDRLLPPFPETWKDRAGPLTAIETARDYHRTLVAGRSAKPGLVRGYNTCTVHPEGRLLAVGTVQGLSVMDLETGRECAFIPGAYQINLFEPSGALLTQHGNLLQRWPVRFDKKDPGRVKIGPPESIPIQGRIGWITCNVDGTMLAAAVGNGAYVWKRDTPKAAVYLGPHNDCRYVALSPNGKLVATGTQNGTGLKVWDAQTGNRIRDLLEGAARTTPTFSHDGLQLFNGMGQSWRVGGDWPEGPRHSEHSVAYAANGNLAAWSGGKGFVSLRHPATGKLLARLEDQNQDAISHIAFSLDGSLLVGVTNDSLCVHVWNLRNLRKELVRLGLDWEAQSLPAAPQREPGPLVVEIVGAKQQ